MKEIKLILAGLLLVCGLAIAGPPIEFLDEQEEARFNALSAELRCLVCQNQSLADSDAGLAEDLRQEVLRLMRDGKSDEETKSFLVARYGDFVLYRPPLQTNTLLLWLGPGAILLIGALLVGLNVRNRARMVLSEPEPEAEPDNQRNTKIS